MRALGSLIVVALPFALALGVPTRAPAADGGSGMFDPRTNPKAPDAGTGRPRPNGPAATARGPLSAGGPLEPLPPGAALGPLPVATGTTRPGMRDAEARYPLKARADGGFVYEAPLYSAAVAPDGTVIFHDRRLEYSAPEATFSFDLSDEFARELGHGTLYAHDKANFLAATFKRRTEMAAKVYAEQMRAAKDDLPHRLDALWADDRYRRRERRRVIFLLWSEVNTSAADARPAAGIIEAWIRKQLPRGSADAYSDDELEALSRERGRGQGQGDERAFRPYGSPLQMRWPSP
jgi:hypothetical protein